jgi:ComF family protein
MKLLSLLFTVREFFFPGGCGLCGTALVEPGEALYGLCNPCRESLEDAPQAKGTKGEGEALRNCERCGRPLISEIGRCLSCREREDWNCDAITLLYPSIGRYRKLLGAYKFGKNLGVGNFLAGRLAERCQELRRGEFPDFELVPVPPRPGKIRRSGWDQVEYLARLLEGQGLPVRRCLKRLPSLTQKKLGRKDRLQNLKGRFTAAGPAPSKAVPRKALIFDDVMTTGATLEACAAALKEAGAEQVRGICLFYD